MTVEKITLSAVSSRLVSPIDLLICCGSFEDRCLSVPKAIGSEGVTKVIVGQHVNLHRHVARNTAILMQLFGDKAIPLALDSGSPVKSADGIADALADCRLRSPSNVLIDTTTFTHESLLILFGLLPGVLGLGDQLSFVYTVAEEYCPGALDEEKWLSKGILDIRTILGYPGSMRPGRATHLVLLHGFEAERSKSLIARYEPALLSLGRPKEGSHTAERHVSTNTRVHEEVLRFAKNTVDVEEFAFNACDPEDSCRAIADRAVFRSELNVVVAPMNTKISALGSAVAAQRNPSIQLCYAQPVMYNYDNYSKASNNCYLFDLPELFGTGDAVRPPV